LANSVRTGFAKDAIPVSNHAVEMTGSSPVMTELAAPVMTELAAAVMTELAAAVMTELAAVAMTESAAAAVTGIGSACRAVPGLAAEELSTTAA
jgi:hypothetical protein